MDIGRVTRRLRRLTPSAEEIAGRIPERTRGRLADDSELADAFLLPAGHTVTARRRPDEGVWLAQVRDAGGEVVSWWEDEDRVAAVEEAYAIAMRMLERNRSFHPEREI